MSLLLTPIITVGNNKALDALCKQILLKPEVLAILLHQNIPELISFSPSQLLEFFINPPFNDLYFPLNNIGYIHALPTKLTSAAGDRIELDIYLEVVLYHKTSTRIQKIRINMEPQSSIYPLAVYQQRLYDYQGTLTSSQPREKN